jgi:hypothetical protein
MADEQNDNQTNDRGNTTGNDHKNELEFDRDFTTWDKLKDKDLITPEAEERIRRDLEEARDEDDEKGR